MTHPVYNIVLILYKMYLHYKRNFILELINKTFCITNHTVLLLSTLLFSYNVWLRIIPS